MRKLNPVLKPREFKSMKVYLSRTEQELRIQQRLEHRVQARVERQH